MARVSVIMPARDAARFIGPAVQSVLDQTYGDWELIVVDDGSKDETQRVLGGFADSRLRVVTQDATAGVSAARNAALRVARSEFVANLDADDVWLPGKLARQVAALDDDPALGFVYTESSSIDAEGHVIHRRLGRGHSGLTCRDLLTGRLPFQTSSVMIRRAFLDEDPYPVDLPVAEDTYVHAVTLWRAGERSIFVDEPLNCYRVHEGSTLGALQPSQRGRFIATAVVRALARMEATRPVPEAVRRDAVAYAHFARAWYCIAEGVDSGLAVRQLAAAAAGDPRWTGRCARQLVKLALRRLRPGSR